MNDFSDFARMPKPIFLTNNVKTIIDNCIEAKSLICGKKINILSTIKNDFKMRCDESQLNQVFNNIIQNSINSIFENNISNGKIVINLIDNNKDYVIKVSDNGIGIMNTKSELVEPYFSTRKKTGGSGLGLSIVNKIITDHDGILDINNNENRTGTCVKLTFNK